MFEYDRGDSPIAIVPQISSPKLQVPLPIDIPSTRGDTSLLLSSKLWAKSGLRSRSANIPHAFREAAGLTRVALPASGRSRCSLSTRAE